MRASIMLHLPALEERGMLQQLAGTVAKLGLTIRGLYGEGSKPEGAIYQLSNQVTLGISEQAAIENLKGIAFGSFERNWPPGNSFAAIPDLRTASGGRWACCAPPGCWVTMNLWR